MIDDTIDCSKPLEGMSQEDEDLYQKVLQEMREEEEAAAKAEEER